jgi:hypothetical protein
MFVAESWGENEEKLMRPLVGHSGLELARMLHEAGIISERLPKKYLEPAELDAFWSTQDLFFTNVLPLRPTGNKVITLCRSKAEVGGKSYVHPPLELGKYLLPEYLPELDRLAREIELVQPNLIVALGNVACWALLRRAGITSIRGTTAECLLVPGVKVLPTFHPAAILRQWQNRPIMLADLIKAKREMEFPEIRRPRREILVNPKLEEIREYYSQFAVGSGPTRSGRGDFPCRPHTTSEGAAAAGRLPRSDVGAEWRQEGSQGARLEVAPSSVALTVATGAGRQAPRALAKVSNVGAIFSEAPTLREYGEHDVGSEELMSIDIETKGKQITMISFSIRKDFALVIPFYDESCPGGNYWQNSADEVKAWLYVKYLLELPIAKLFQNGLYDLQYLYRFGFRPVNCLHDTMLLHHAILPEMQKGLGFLGSIYTQEASWKLMRRVRAKELSSKADE